MPDIPRDESAGVADRTKDVSAPAAGGTKATQGDSTLHEPQSAATGKPKTGRATASAAKSTPLAVSMEDLGEQIGRGVRSGVQASAVTADGDTSTITPGSSH